MLPKKHIAIALFLLSASLSAVSFFLYKEARKSIKRDAIQREMTLRSENRPSMPQKSRERRGISPPKMVGKTVADCHTTPSKIDEIWLINDNLIYCRGKSGIIIKIIFLKGDRTLLLPDENDWKTEMPTWAQDRRDVVRRVRTLVWREDWTVRLPELSVPREEQQGKL